MDIMVIIGWALSFALLIFGMVFSMDAFRAGQSPLIWSNILMFIDIPSIAIVLGGTLATLMVAYPAKVWTQILKHLKIIFAPTKYDPYAYIEQIVEFAKEARVKGLLSLEDKLNDVKDPFLKKSLMLVVDSVEPEKVKALLESDIENLEDRHAQSRSFYDRAAILSPAFGMLGTVMGLIAMLKNLEDPDTIGAALAVALVTTFYGSVLSNVVFIPISTKLKARHEEEYLCRMLVCEGVQAIQAGENPKFIEEKLTMLLADSMKKSKDKEAEE